MARRGKRHSSNQRGYLPTVIVAAVVGPVVTPVVVRSVISAVIGPIIATVVVRSIWRQGCAYAGADPRSRFSRGRGHGRNAHRGRKRDGGNECKEYAFH